MKTIALAALALTIPVMAATSLREPVSGFGAFQVLPDAPYPSQAAGLSWASEGHVQILAGAGPQYALAVTAPHLRVAFANADLDLVDPQTNDYMALWRRSEFDLGTGIALSQLGLGMGAFDIAFGGDLVRIKERDLDSVGPSQKASWIEPSMQVRIGSTRITASLERFVELERDSLYSKDAVVKLGYGAVRSDGLQWGIGVSVPLNDDREFGLQVGTEKNFSQALSFRLQGSTLYRKAPSTLPADSMQRKWIRSGLGLAVGTTLRFRPWLADRDPTWIQNIVDPLCGNSWARYVYDWEIGAMVQLDALGSTSAAAVTVGRWF